MDWGIDPERVRELTAVAQARRLSARETELFAVQITGGGANADIPLWDMLTVLFALGHLSGDPGQDTRRNSRQTPRDWALTCLFDQSEMSLQALRRAGTRSLTAAGARIACGPAGVEVAYAARAGDEGPPRSFGWPRIRLALALADFLFGSAAPKQGLPDGLGALSIGLDAVFDAGVFDHALLKRAIQEPARFMRGWRRRHLPLQAFADLVREREAFLAARGRTRVGRDLDADDALALWSFTREREATWTYARFLEKLAALAREERQGAGRRGFIDAMSMDDLAGAEPAHDPEEALLAWLDMARGQLGQTSPEPQPAPPSHPPALHPPAGGNPYDEEQDGPELAEERSVLALLQLPDAPKFLTGEQRQQIAALLGLMPLAHDLPLALLRAQATRDWENRLIEATRRGTGGGRGPVDTAPPPFDYRGEVEGLAAHAERLRQLVLAGAALGAAGPLDADRQEGLAILRKLQRDRASFRLEDGELAQIFTEAQGALLTVSRTLRQIARRGQAFAARVDLQRQGRDDQTAFINILARRLPAEAKT